MAPLVPKPVLSKSLYCVHGRKAENDKKFRIRLQPSHSANHRLACIVLPKADNSIWNKS